jgi:hypothetical protein
VIGIALNVATVSTPGSIVLIFGASAAHESRPPREPSAPALRPNAETLRMKPRRDRFEPFSLMF